MQAWQAGVKMGKSQNKTRAYLFSVLINLVITTLLLGCGKGFKTKNDLSSSFDLASQGAQSSAEIFALTLFPSVKQNCGTCHGSFQTPLFAVSDSNAAYNTLTSSNLVSMTAPDSSRLVTKVRAGHSGIAVSVADEMKNLIQQWADEVAAQDAANASSASIAPGSLASLEALKVTLHPTLVQSCGACHGINQAPLFAVSNAQSVQDLLVQAQLVSLTTPSSSRLVTKIRGGHQGFPVSVADSIQSQISAWIRASDPKTLPAQTPLTASFASISQKILVPRCVSCHAGANAEDGIRYDSYNATLATVNRNTPTQSRLYTSTVSRDMPTDPTLALTKAETDIILSWIQAGAPNN